MPSEPISALVVPERSNACGRYANVRRIRTMCSERMDGKFIWRVFEHGAHVVLVSGGHIGDCHYIDTNHWTVKREKRIHKRMAKMGIRPERLRLSWISAAEGSGLQV